METIETVYGASVTNENVPSLHPNPYFERKDFVLLDGIWDFRMDKRDALPLSYEEKIRVPFAVESRLSLIHRSVSKDDYLHYRRIVSIPEDKRDGLFRLVFTAVDQEAKVFVDGMLLKEHRFGYAPFDVVFPINGRESVSIEVIVHDDTDSPLYGRGKQSNKPGGIWYHPTSGIWGSVYLEYLPNERYITSLSIRPDFDNKEVTVEAPSSKEGKTAVEILYGDKVVATGEVNEKQRVTIPLGDCFHPWNQKHPCLYEVRVTCDEDAVSSAFAFRKVERKKIGNAPIVCLNGEPLFLSALLDQGYYPESGLTPPSLGAMRNDIETAKRLGYNCLRKHIKVEPMRWYYLCDSLGMYVIQDFVSGGSPYSFFAISAPALLPFYNPNDAHSKALGRGSLESRNQFERELVETFQTLSNVPSIIAWTLFNEGWGQFEAVRMTEELKKLDSTRLIDSTSGWHDKGVGDFSSKHIYFTPLKMKRDKERILSLSEFGGFALREEGHVETKRSFGYKKFKTKEGLEKALSRLYSKVRSLITEKGLGVAVYTELTDVEDELNGLLTYDRKVLKVDESFMRSLNESLYKAFEEMVQKQKTVVNDAK